MDFQKLAWNTMVTKWGFETETVMKQHDVTTMACSSGIERWSGSSETSELATSLFPCEPCATTMKCLHTVSVFARLAVPVINVVFVLMFLVWCSLLVRLLSAFFLHFSCVSKIWTHFLSFPIIIFYQFFTGFIKSLVCRNCLGVRIIVQTF